MDSRMLRTTLALLKLLLLLLLHLNDAEAVISSQHRLSRDLLSNYTSRSLRPVLNPNTTVNVFFRAKPYWLSDFEEERQLLTYLSRNQIKWTDELLRWDPNDYDGVDEITFSPSQIWFPDITLYERVGVGRALTNVNEALIVVNFKGEAVYYEIMQLTVFCKMDVRTFPFDSHNCLQRYTSYSYHGGQLYLHATTDNAALEDVLVRNGVWSLSSFKVEEVVNYYTCCPFPYVEVHYTLNIKRQPWFYVVNIGIPTLLLSCAALAVFLLHPGSGEKISFSVSNVLALVVFQQLLSTSMPPTGDQTPIIAYYFATVISVAFITVLTTTCTLRLYHNNGRKPLPSLLKRLKRDVSSKQDGCLPKSSTKSSTSMNGNGKLQIGEESTDVNSMRAYETSMRDPRQALNPSNVITTESLPVISRTTLTNQNGTNFHFNGSGKVEDNTFKDEWQQAAIFIDKMMFCFSFLVIIFMMLYCAYRFVVEVRSLEENTS
ncbi:neuronal acetylcholine receptor subunit alpha-10-like [Apostichopus japonicus]|uniref:neuronal acetylcholine receptor subunit alpha-10-like n=1 Tax=Stichopus japonicus TaxID=307972 RepID=UPI003AB60AF2